jgi:hypothetical protein
MLNSAPNFNLFGAQKFFNTDLCLSKNVVLFIFHFDFIIIEIF